MSKNNKVACLKQDIYHQRWLEEVRQCNNRPDGMTVTQWCEQNNLVPATYYAHAKKIKNLYLDQLEMVKSPAPAFVELPVPDISESQNSSAVTISIGKATIEVTENTSDSLLVKILGAISHAQ